jgi:hypothetical protein
VDAGLEERAIEARRRDLAAAGVCLAVAAVAIQSALYLADVYVLDRRVGTFDVDREGGLGGWALAVLLLAPDTGDVVAPHRAEHSVPGAGAAGG